MNKKHNRYTVDSVSEYLKNNLEFINFDYYNIKGNEIETKMDASDKESKSDLIYLKMAETWGSSSHCKRMQVGCLVVKDKSIISDGYNGSPSGFPNVCESEEMITLPYVLHAEANAITKLAKSTQSSINSTMYVTLSPCFECAKLIIQSGIKRIVFCEVYRNIEPLIFLSEGGIEITRISKKYLSKNPVTF
jgi:dCMP deaminase